MRQSPTPEARAWPVGVGSLIIVDTTVPVDVASVAAEVRRLHACRTG